MSLLVLSGCSNKFSLTEDQLTKDLIGQSVRINGDPLEIREDNLVDLSIEEIATKDNESRVIADIQLEELEEEAGESNEQKRKNHINHIYKGQVLVDYSRFENSDPWMITQASSRSIFSIEEVEVLNLIDPIPPLEKSKEDVLNDLQTQYMGSVMVEGSEHFGILEKHVSFDVTDSEEITNTRVKNIHSFSIADTKEGSYSLEYIVPTEVSFDFGVENAFDMYEENGSYQVSGSMNVVYELVEDEETGKTSWMITDVDTGNTAFEIEKL